MGDAKEGEKVRYRLIVEPVGRCDAVEAQERLRRALKALRRAYRLRCVEVVDVDAERAQPE